MYSVRGRTTATAATADHAIAQLWNPHATQRIKVISFALFKTTTGTAADSLRLRRSSGRGATPSSTVTPGIENHSERAVAPPSGVLLDMGAFGTQPTLVAASELGPDWIAAAFAAAGINYAIPGGIVVPPGTGLVIAQITATAWPISGVTFVWLEDW